MAIYSCRNLGLPALNLLRVKGMHILQQLMLEERLLRTTSDNWCIINDGTEDRNIVMGASGRPAELLKIDSVLQDKVAVIRRFTGGGTVIVDHSTVFVSFICNKDALPDVQPYPGPIMSWSSLIYDDVFRQVGDFSLCENAANLVGMRNQLQKHDGYIIHLSSGTLMLVTWPISNFQGPEYRKERDHLEFLCRLRDYLPRSNFIDRTIHGVERHFPVEQRGLEAVESRASYIVFKPTSKVVAEQELKEALFRYQRV
ncbi:OLC1v1024388C1 [Oldenlandia corymbosa var. corymbosa]|uniref:OLC1v1024388C1 n=1 Tax=Oldenlandia corymbosa var. corymbosa TaxID=529605 RepID=A0AAV1C511_OLDCO|nr:OLC1v1024388C1 [Oldenlandia corymbosa var. corymbosa]